MPGNSRCSQVQFGLQVEYGMHVHVSADTVVSRDGMLRLDTYLPYTMHLLCDSTHDGDG
jgi:hypothetical protein